MYFLLFPRFWTLSIERFWFLFWSILNGVSSSRKRSSQQEFATRGDGWNQASLQSSLFSRLAEDGDRRCDLIGAFPVTLHFFPLCVLKRCSPLYFEPKPNLLKTLEGLLMRLVIFVNTIFELNSLNIAVSVCYVSVIEMNRKQRSRPSFFVCLFLCSTLLNISVGEFASVVSVSCLESETGLESLCGSPWSRKSQQPLL